MGFITIEGIEGAGKSTLRAQLAERLASLELEVVVTREPGATELGQTLRSLLLDAKQNNLAPLAELMLFYADRAQHLQDVIRPALSRGAVVLCDRYIHSTIAYQGYGRGIALAPLLALTEFVTAGTRPDLVLLLDLDPVEGLSRARIRTSRASGVHSLQEQALGEEAIEPEQKSFSGSSGASSLAGASAEESWNRFEQQKLEFHQKVRAGFRELSEDPQNRFVVLDARKSPETLADEAFAAVKQTLLQLRNR